MAKRLMDADLWNVIEPLLSAPKPRRSRYVGLVKTHLQHLALAAAINFVRIGQRLDDIPLAKTRQSSFVRLWAPPVPA
jgi:hypothetical protein